MFSDKQIDLNHTEQTDLSFVSFYVRKIIFRNKSYMFATQNFWHRFCKLLLSLSKTDFLHITMILIIES